MWGGILSLADPGGSECREFRDGRLAKSGQDQHTSNALVQRSSGDPSIRDAEDQRVVVWKSERMLQTGQGIRTIPLEYDAFGMQAVHGY